MFFFPSHCLIFLTICLLFIYPSNRLLTTSVHVFLAEDQLPPGFPTIDMGPQLKVVERTRTATMLCAASGNPDPDISWFKDFLPVNTTNNNGRIKQLRSGRFSSTDKPPTTGIRPPIVSSVLSSYSSSHDLTSHLASHVLGKWHCFYYFLSSTLCLLAPVCCCLCVSPFVFQCCHGLLGLFSPLLCFAGFCPLTFCPHRSHCCDFFTTDYFGFLIFLSTALVQGLLCFFFVWISILFIS